MFRNLQQQHLLYYYSLQVLFQSHPHYSLMEQSSLNQKLLGYTFVHFHSCVEMIEIFYLYEACYLSLITLAGTPTAVTFAGIFSVTTAPAPIIQFAPMFIFGKTVAPNPIKVNSPILPPN